jgi:hypothetical protein
MAFSMNSLNKENTLVMLEICSESYSAERPDGVQDDYFIVRKVNEKDKEVVVIAFKGSESCIQWIFNGLAYVFTLIYHFGDLLRVWFGGRPMPNQALMAINFFSSAIYLGCVKVALLKYKNRYNNIIKDDSKVVFTGHSRGGALAIAAAVCFMGENEEFVSTIFNGFLQFWYGQQGSIETKLKPENIQIVTFGSPTFRFSDKTINGKVDNLTVGYAHKKDMVPYPIVRWIGTRRTLTTGYDSWWNPFGYHRPACYKACLSAKYKWTFEDEE